MTAAAQPISSVTIRPSNPAIRHWFSGEQDEIRGKAAEFRICAPFLPFSPGTSKTASGATNTMSSADLQSASRVRGSGVAAARPRRLAGRVLSGIARLIGGFLLTGIFLGLRVAVSVLSAFYGFVWFAQHH